MDIAVSFGSTGAQVLSNFPPIPGLGVAAGLLVAIIELCQNVSTNRAAARLGDRCHRLLLDLRDSGEDWGSPKMKTALDAIEQALRFVDSKMHAWGKLKRLKAFLDQKAIADDIQNCHIAIDDWVTKFNVTSQIEIHRWQSQFKENATRDHNEVIAYLSDIKNGEDIVIEVLNEVLERQNKMAHDIMEVMQHALVESDPRQKRNLKHNLYRLQVETGELLPDFNLQRDEL
jgi:hypothetical protein